MVVVVLFPLVIVSLIGPRQAFVKDDNLNDFQKPIHILRKQSKNFLTASIYSCQFGNVTIDLGVGSSANPHGRTDLKLVLSDRFRLQTEVGGSSSERTLPCTRHESVNSYHPDLADCTSKVKCIRGC